MNIEIKIPGYPSGAQPTVNVTHPTSLQPIPIEYNVNVSDSSGTETAARPITSQTYRQKTYVTPPAPIINTSHTKNVVTSTSMRTRERDIQVNPAVAQDQTVYHGYYTTPVTVTSSKTPQQQYIAGPLQQVNPQMSLVQYDNRSFQATMDLSQYSPQEVQVRVKDRTVTVTANHKEANHQGGFTQRSYSRQYTLPDDVNPNLVKCFISERGELSVEAPRMQPLTTHDRIVPIVMRSPQQPPPPPPPPQHIQPLQSTQSTSNTNLPPPPPPPPVPVEKAPKRPPRPTNYTVVQPVVVNKPPTPQRTPTVSFRAATNEIDSGKQQRPPAPEVVNERQTPFVEDVTSDVETQKIDFKSAKRMFEN